MKLPDIIIKIDKSLRDLIQEFLAKIAKIPPRKPQIEPIPARSIEAIRERARRLVLLSTPTVNIDYSSGRLAFDSLPITLEHKAIDWGAEFAIRPRQRDRWKEPRFRMKRRARQLIDKGDYIMLSNSLPSKGSALNAGISFATRNGLTTFFMAVDPVTKLYYYLINPEIKNKNQIIFARMELVKGKWKDKPLLAKGKEARRAGANG